MNEWLVWLQFPRILYVIGGLITYFGLGAHFIRRRRDNGNPVKGDDIAFFAIMGFVLSPAWPAILFVYGAVSFFQWVGRPIQPKPPVPEPEPSPVSDSKTYREPKR